MNISLHFLWQEGNCWNDLRELTDVIKNTVCYRQWGLKREIKGSFSAGLLRRGFDGETKEFSPSLHFTFSLLSFALCSSFSRQSPSSLAMAQSALPSPDAWALGSHAGCDFFFDRLPNRDRDSQRQAKAPFHTQLDRAKKPSFVLDFPSKKCNHVLPPLAFKGYFPIHCHKIHFTRTQVRQIAVRARLLALPKNMWRQASFVTSFVSFFLPLCIFSWFF